LAHGLVDFHPSWPAASQIDTSHIHTYNLKRHRAANTLDEPPSSRFEDRNTSVTSPTESAYSTHDGLKRHGLRGPIALPLSHAPGQPICRLQLPRVCQEKDKRCFQSSHCGERRAQSTGADAEGPEGAADIEGGYSSSGRICVVRGQSRPGYTGDDARRDENVLLMMFTPTETNSRFTILPARSISCRGWQDRKADRKPWRHC
jgi:hypothetical protein